jgi:hypothetical protein
MPPLSYPSGEVKIVAVWGTTESLLAFPESQIPTAEWCHADGLDPSTSETIRRSRRECNAPDRYLRPGDPRQSPGVVWPRPEAVNKQ